MERKHEFQLNDSPKDHISAIKFHKTLNHLLLVSSWDGSVRLYDTDSNRLIINTIHEEPVLDCIFMGPSHTAFGGTDGIVKLNDLNADYVAVVGCHDDAINCVEYAPKKNVLLSGSWDRTMKIFDVRKKGSVATYEQCDGRVYSMSVVDEKIAIATSERKALIWDLRNMKNYLILHLLNHQPRCIKISPNKQCYVIGHIDGRVAVEYINRDPEVRKCRTRFKCHRMKRNNNEYVYTVNSISFHNAYNTFATGGTNGYVNIWDGVNRKRLCQYRRYETSVSSLAFNHDGSKLAIACSALCEPCTKTSVNVRYVNQQKVKPINQP